LFDYVYSLQTAIYVLEKGCCPTRSPFWRW